MLFRLLIAGLLFLNINDTFAQVARRIKVDQFGYIENSQKIAIISQAKQGFNAPQSYAPSDTLEVVKYFTGEIVFADKILVWNSGNTHIQSGDKVWFFDFSALTDTGHYYIHDPVNDYFSHVFRISDDVYNEPLKHAVRMFYYQRCGVAKEADYAGEKWKDTPCHIHSNQDLNCRFVKDKNNAALEKDLSGGWHDAGDFNKYTTFTYSTVHQLLFAYEESPDVFFDNYGIPESGNGVPDLLDEIKVELDWLIKMQLADGSVLSKVSVSDHQGASPVSQDNAERYYGEASSSASRAVASLFAHAYLIYKDIPLYQTYANELKTNAIKAWTYLVANPSYSAYDNGGFTSASPERSEYDQEAYLLTAAYFLYKATAEQAYLDNFEAGISYFHAISWNYWYLFEYTYERVLLDYCFLPEADPDKLTLIKNSFASSMAGEEFMQAVNYQTDAYRAYLKDGDYVWGSNSGKSNVGNLFYDASRLQTDETNITKMKNASIDFLHYLHGRNAIDRLFLSNMYDYGAERPVNEMYHIWFGDGTKYDNAQSSTNGPPPGYLTGGVNKQFAPDASYSGSNLQPPLNQPVQKSYKDWNTSWPENSWEITEPAIYYQAAYIHLLSKFASTNQNYSGNPKLVGKDDPENNVGFNETLNNKPKIYPNPIKYSIFVEISEKNAFIEIINLSGIKVFHSQLKQGTNKITPGNLGTGIYIARIVSEKGVFTDKFIVK
ncbi:MAG: glycoside hydrolase family 9 protein [Bacteroidales bacterium]|nr:glycoside hydrolase family 9 protein [Bacteroidales bacterium]